MEDQTGDQFISERLQNLNNVDEKIVALLDHLSSTINNLKEGKISELTSPNIENQFKEKFQESVNNFYSDLETMSSRLRREIILIDKKTAFNQESSNDISLLPISIDRKANWVGDWKFKNQVNLIKNLINNDEKIVNKIDFSRKFQFEEVNNTEEAIIEQSPSRVKEEKEDTKVEESKLEIITMEKQLEEDTAVTIDATNNTEGNCVNVKLEPTIQMKPTFESEIKTEVITDFPRDIESVSSKHATPEKKFHEDAEGDVIVVDDSSPVKIVQIEDKVVNLSEEEEVDDDDDFEGIF